MGLLLLGVLATVLIAGDHSFARFFCGALVGFVAVIVGRGVNLLVDLLVAITDLASGRALREVGLQLV
jgi:hypothetical protein